MEDRSGEAWAEEGEHFILWFGWKEDKFELEMSSRWFG